MKCQTFFFDGGHGRCEDIGVSENARKEDMRWITLAFVSHEHMRRLFESEDFVELYCQHPLENCEGRDVKGIYQRARAGEIHSFTDISSLYEEPEKPELVVNTGNIPPEQCTNQIISLHDNEIISSPQ